MLSDKTKLQMIFINQSLEKSLLITTHGCVPKEYVVGAKDTSKGRLLQFIQTLFRCFNTKPADFFDSIYIITRNCINITALNIKLLILDFLC